MPDSPKIIKINLWKILKIDFLSAECQKNSIKTLNFANLKTHSAASPAFFQGWSESVPQNRPYGDNWNMFLTGHTAPASQPTVPIVSYITSTSVIMHIR